MQYSKYLTINRFRCDIVYCDTNDDVNQKHFVFALSTLQFFWPLNKSILLEILYDYVCKLMPLLDYFLSLRNKVFPIYKLLQC